LAGWVAARFGTEVGAVKRSDALVASRRGDGMSAVEAAPARGAEWRCPKCNRAFRRARQAHSCKTVPLEEHLRHDDALRSLFSHLLDELKSQVGSCEVISLPCCIHLFGTYDFLAVLARKRHLEIRFALRRRLEDPRVTRCVQIGKSSYKHSVDVEAAEDIDDELLGWLSEAYHLGDV
jgi:hypothetical protein